MQTKAVADMGEAKNVFKLIIGIDLNVNITQHRKHGTDDCSYMRIMHKNKKVKKIVR